MRLCGRLGPDPHGSQLDQVTIGVALFHRINQVGRGRQIVAEGEERLLRSHH